MLFFILRSLKAHFAIIHTYTYIHIHIHTYTCIYMHILYVYIHIHSYTYSYMHIPLYTYNIHTFTYIYLHTLTWAGRKLTNYGKLTHILSGFLPSVISQFYPISQLLMSVFYGYHSHWTPISESLISVTPISRHPNSDITVPELRY
jgi:hypothetical protein